MSRRMSSSWVKFQAIPFRLRTAPTSSTIQKMRPASKWDVGQKKGPTAAYKAEYCCECTVIIQSNPDELNRESEGEYIRLSPVEIMQMHQNFIRITFFIRMYLDLILYLQLINKYRQKIWHIKGLVWIITLHNAFGQ